MTRSLANDGTARVIELVTTEISAALTEHRAFVMDVLSGLVTELVSGSAEFVHKEIDAVRAEFMGRIEKLNAEIAQLRSDIAAMEFETGARAGFPIMQRARPS